MEKGIKHGKSFKNKRSRRSYSSKKCNEIYIKNINREILDIIEDLKATLEFGTGLGMGNPLHYRNKAQYPIGINKNEEPVIGVFANRTHEVIPMEKCLIQNPISEEIAKTVLEFIKKNKISVYNEKTVKGLFRHIVIKIGIKTNEVMCILVINGNEIPKENELVEILTQKYPNIKTIVKNINIKNTNVILGKENVNIYGNGYIEDKLGEYTFKISPLSFYQVNPVQAERLYNIGVKAAKITKKDTVFDLYYGIGTISLFMAKYAKKVYGVEIVEQAIRDLAKVEEVYEVKEIQPIDMFPFTGHVECVIVLRLKL